ncbi:MAG TPA: hypothetical protein PLP07_07845 [Pyrinomonadaceae bacterium]|nr:hypothetical protein [Chloracidobacterium sp.]HQX55824.1 hypothetical protein [Pyrinomonadaceae bacterium]HQY67793.1 hypothetical protein [Pyrinomonadaceae bacterium]
MAALEKYYAPAVVNKWRTMALGVGGIALIIWAVGCYFNTEQALRSWLVGFVFWGGIGLGSLGVLMLQYLTGGAWGVVIRRTVEAGSRTLPLIVLLFIPLAIGVYTRNVYEFTHLPADDPVMLHRGVFMAPWFWIVRSAIYFAIWYVMVHLLNKWSAEQDKTDNILDAERFLDRASRFSGPTLVIYSLIVTFAVVDWVMMLDPHWFSTMWGLLFVAGWALSCFCFVVAVLASLSDKAPMDGIVGKRHFHDLGKLMLALTMVWAYFNFSQFLIIWSGNLPEETTWYLTRMKGGWGYIGVLLIIFHFAFPFLVLLQQDFKRKARWLSALAIFILVMRLVDMFYQIAPTPRITEGIATGAFHIDWLDIVAPVAIGGIWLWWFFGELLKRPLVPVQDPFFESAIDHGKGH